MADKLIKVNLAKADCRGIYFVNNDDLFGGKEIHSAPTYINRDFKLVLRVTHTNESNMRTQTKKSYAFSKKITFLQAVRQVSSQREALLQKLIEGTHQEEKRRIPTLKQAWEDYVEMKKNQLSANTLVSYTTFMNKWILSEPTLSKSPIEPFRSIFVWLSHGRRQNEILSLSWEDINFENGTYTIKFENNKVRKPMTYKLTHELIKTLETLGIGEKGYIFHALKDNTKKMSKETVRNHWNKILEQVGIKIRMHDLRHLIGGTLVSSGKTLEQVASVLGHTSTSVTKRYSKVREEVAAESLDDFFKRVR